MMPKKDYVAIAADIRDLRAARGTLDDLARRLAALFAGDNPKFDVTRFLRACGLENSR